jgi:hypothetical protein
MEDISVRYDGTVRNSLGSIIQFLYGEDGMDACFIEKQKLPTVKMDDKACGPGGRQCQVVLLGQASHPPPCTCADALEEVLHRPSQAGSGAAAAAVRPSSPAH